jgi:hypothetical protein
MAAGYYIHKPSSEKAAVERWENEGGRLGQNYDFILDSIGENRFFPDYLCQLECELVG